MIKQPQIKNLDKIPVENTILGDKIKISKNDYTLLIDTSKKYYAGRNNHKQLKSKISILQQDLTEVKSLLHEIMDFIDYIGLRKKSENFLHKNINRDIQK